MILDDGLPAHLADLARTFPDHVPPGLGLERSVTYKEISTVEGANHDGPSGLLTVRYQLTAHGETHAAALELAKALRARFRQPVGALGSVTVKHNRVENAYDLGFSEDAKAWQYAIDVVFTAKE